MEQQHAATQAEVQMTFRLVTSVRQSKVTESGTQVTQLQLQNYNMCAELFLGGLYQSWMTAVKIGIGLHSFCLQ